MTTYRTSLPQLDGRTFLTDGGIETTLIFQKGFDLPYFAAFILLNDQHGYQALKDYYETYASIAVRAHTGFILESPTWRANRDWAEKIGYNKEQLAEVNKQAVHLLDEIRAEYAVDECPFVISGCVGPRGDGYVVAEKMSAQQAQHYHAEQIDTFAQTQADMITAVTMTYPEEAIGITLAAMNRGLPVAISFTTETDGLLPCGMTIEEAIKIVDAQTDAGPIYYMINCAHPDHFQQALASGKDWVKRIRGVRANASRKSHAELDESETLDSGNPDELAMIYSQLVAQFPNFNVLGGCCGTDHRHIGKISESCVH